MAKTPKNDRIETTTDPVIISSTAPTITQVLKATSGTAASWQTLSYTDLADGTDGELITWSAAGEPAVVGAGNVGQVLTSAGAGAVPTFQNTVVLTKTIVIEDPVAESLPFFFTSGAITITQVRALIQGGTSIPVTVASGTTYLTVVATNVNAQTASNTTTGADLTIAASGVAVNSHVWLTLGTPVLTQTLLTVTLKYTEV